MNVLPYGPEGWLVEVHPDDVIGFATAVERRGHPAVTEIVPAAETVLVRLTSATRSAEVRSWLLTVVAGSTDQPPAGPTIEITVIYDGEDLPAVAAATDLSVEEVVDRHRASPFVGAFCGFAPGFAYLRGLDPSLHLPRRATPRSRVPAGAVAIADVYGAVYPSPSPGGWHLIGRTDAAMWDVDRVEPALVRPGTSVRFVPA